MTIGPGSHEGLGSAEGVEGEYSEVADQQLDELETGDPDLYGDVLVVCEAIFSDTARAQSMSAAVQTDGGIVFRLAVPGRHPYKVFWTSSGPRIEAVFPYP
jgi:hypothetical protein